MKMICVDTDLRRFEDAKNYSRPPLLEEPSARRTHWGKKRESESRSPCLALVGGMGGRHQQKEVMRFLAE